MVQSYSHLTVQYTPDLNAMLRALEGNGWSSGLSCTAGSGMTVSITAGSGFHGGVSWSTNQTAITVCAANATHNRRDTVFWSKSLAALTHITGSATVLPKPMTLPASQIPVHEIFVSFADTQLSSDNITDKRVPFGLGYNQAHNIALHNKLGITGQRSLYGDESDGAVTETSNGNRSGILFCTAYSCSTGITTTVNDKILAVLATSSITIVGTLDASGQGASGGSGGAGATGAGSIGSVGSAGHFNGAAGTGGAGGGVNTTGTAGGEGAGGGGGGGSGSAGGAGYNAKAATYTDGRRTYPNLRWDAVMELSNSVGTGGSGGGGGGGDGSSAGGNGATGGSGGGCVLLCAPKIIITGTINVSGDDASNGSNGAGGNAGGGGGGSGGNAGTIILITPNLTEGSATYTKAGGTAGTGGTGQGTAGDGGAGGTGATGATVKLT